MFDKFITEYLDIVKCDARKSQHIVQYEKIPIYEEILQYVSDNHLIISNITNMVGDTTASNQCGSSKAFTSPILKSYQMDINYMSKFVIYGQFIFKHANDMANIITEKHTPMVELYTVIKNRMFTMKINNEANMIQFINIDPIDIRQIQPVDNKWLPPMVELIDIYHKLYIPSLYGDRNDWIRLESACWDRFYTKSNHTTKKSIKPYNSILLKWVTGRKDCVLIGAMATTHSSRNKYMIQITTVTNIDIIINELRTLMKRILKKDIKHRTYHVENIPGEYRITRTLILSNNDYIMEIYNTASYELIPYIEVDNVQVGMPYVLLYHMMIDYWLIGTMEQKKILTTHSANIIRSEYMDIMSNIKAKMFTVKMEPYMGKYVDSELTKKRLNLTSQFRPYVPAEYKRDHGEFRVI